MLNNARLNRFLSGFAAFGFLFTCPPQLIAQESSSQMIRRFQRAVVVVTTYDDRGKPLLQGSGFFIASDRVVTSSHLIRHASQIRVKTFDGATVTVQSVLAFSDKTDLAVLQIQPTGLDVASFQLENSPPLKGEPVILISNPQGAHWKISHGNVGQTWEFSDLGKRIEITAAVRPGSSGGPVINDQGRVIGVAAMHVPGADDLNFAVPSESLRALQASAGL